MLPYLRAFAARHRRFLSFCAVGASGVLVNLLVFWLALYLLEGRRAGEGAAGGWWVNNIALFLGWVVSVSSNFALNDRLTFRDASAAYETSWRRRVASYYTTALVAFAIQWSIFNGLVWSVDSAMGAPIRSLATEAGVLSWLVGIGLEFRRTVANLAGIGVATIANYLLAKYWVFRRAPDAADTAAEDTP